MIRRPASRPTFLSIKILSVFLCAGVVLNSLEFASAFSYPAASPPLYLAKLRLPSELGMVTDYFQVSGSDNSKPETRNSKLVILIQNLHVHSETQRKIREILNFLLRHPDFNNIRLIGLEGAQGAMPPLAESAQLNPAVKRKVADFLIREGELTGPEAFALEKGQEHLLWGVENQSYYRANRNLYLMTLAARKEIQKRLAYLDERLTDIAGKLPQPPALKKVIQTEKALAEGQAAPAEVLRQWLQQGARLPLQMRPYPCLSALADLMELSASSSLLMNMQDQARQFLSLLTPSLMTAERRELEGLAKGDPALFYLRLAWLAREHHKDQELPPPLQRYAKSLAGIRNFNAFEVTTELLTFAPEFKAFLATDHRSQNVFLAQKSTQFLKRYLTQQVTDAEVTQWTRHLREMIARVKALGLLSRHEIDELTHRISNQIDFFCLALVRNSPMADNLIAEMQRRRSPQAVLVAGGFHTRGLTDALQSKGLSYLVITPSIQGDITPEYINLYESRLADQHLSQEQIAKGVAQALTTPRWLEEPLWPESGHIPVVKAALSSAQLTSKRQNAQFMPATSIIQRVKSFFRQHLILRHAAVAVVLTVSVFLLWQAYEAFDVSHQSMAATFEYKDGHLLMKLDEFNHYAKAGLPVKHKYETWDYALEQIRLASKKANEAAYNASPWSDKPFWKPHGVVFKSYDASQFIEGIRGNVKIVHGADVFDISSLRLSREAIVELTGQQNIPMNLYPVYGPSSVIDLTDTSRFHIEKGLIVDKDGNVYGITGEGTAASASSPSSTNWLNEFSKYKWLLLIPAVALVLGIIAWTLKARDRHRGDKEATSIDTKVAKPDEGLKKGLSLIPSPALRAPSPAGRGNAVVVAPASAPKEKAAAEPTRLETPVRKEEVEPPSHALAQPGKPAEVRKEESPVAEPPASKPKPPVEVVPPIVEPIIVHPVRKPPEAPDKTEATPVEPTAVAPPETSATPAAKPAARSPQVEETATPEAVAPAVTETVPLVQPETVALPAESAAAALPVPEPVTAPLPEPVPTGPPPSEPEPPAPTAPPVVSDADLEAAAESQKTTVEALLKQAGTILNHGFTRAYGIYPDRIQQSMIRRVAVAPTLPQKGEAVKEIAAEVIAMEELGRPLTETEKSKVLSGNGLRDTIRKLKTVPAGATREPTETLTPLATPAPSAAEASKEPSEWAKILLAFGEKVKSALKEVWPLGERREKPRPTPLTEDSLRADLERNKDKVPDWQGIRRQNYYELQDQLISLAKSDQIASNPILLVADIQKLRKLVETGERLRVDVVCRNVFGRLFIDALTQIEKAFAQHQDKFYETARDTQIRLLTDIRSTLENTFADLFQAQPAVAPVAADPGEGVPPEAAQPPATAAAPSATSWKEKTWGVLTKIPGLKRIGQKEETSAEDTGVQRSEPGPDTPIATPVAPTPEPTAAEAEAGVEPSAEPTTGPERAPESKKSWKERLRRGVREIRGKWFGKKEEPRITLRPSQISVDESPSIENQAKLHIGYLDRKLEYIKSLAGDHTFSIFSKMPAIKEDILKTQIEGDKLLENGGDLPEQLKNKIWHLRATIVYLDDHIVQAGQLLNNIIMVENRANNRPPISSLQLELLTLREQKNTHSNLASFHELDILHEELGKRIQDLPRDPSGRDPQAGKFDIGKMMRLQGLFLSLIGGHLLLTGLAGQAVVWPIIGLGLGLLMSPSTTFTVFQAISRLIRALAGHFADALQGIKANKIVYTGASSTNVTANYINAIPLTASRSSEGRNFTADNPKLDSQMAHERERLNSAA